MMRRPKSTWIVLSLLFAGLLGYWLARSATPETKVGAGETQERRPVRTSVVEETERRYRVGDREDAFRFDQDALDEGALVGQRALVFADRDALERFLARAGDGIVILGRLDALNALRVSFLNYDDLAGLLDGTEEESFIYPVYLPDPVGGSVQAGGVGMGNQLLDWLGITGDNSMAGKGVKIAVLDTGISQHSALRGSITSINLVDLPGNLADWNGHGTAVASLIAGSNSWVPGVAPGSDLISVRIANDQGSSDSFTLAQGIIAAADAGAQIINISMASNGDALVVRNALEYAQSKGALVIASAGNDGYNQVSYPAANAGVIAVGAVDATGSHLAFSNTGSAIAVAAPGYDVNAAWTGNQAVGFTGTSASAPIVAGAVAYTMTQAGSGNLTSTQAWELIRTNLNDGGAPGADSVLGGGTLDLGRVVNAGTPGIYDAALASHWVAGPTEEVPYTHLQVTVQNRGTETLINTAVNINTGFSTAPINITTLAPGEIRTLTIPINDSRLQASESFQFDSTVSLSGGQTDSNPSNDRRVETFVPAGSQ
jgi:hypothetical protein